jgi:hypothetical protein
MKTSSWQVALSAGIAVSECSGIIGVSTTTHVEYYTIDFRHLQAMLVDFKELVATCGKSATVLSSLEWEAIFERKTCAVSRLQLIRSTAVACVYMSSKTL